MTSPTPSPSPTPALDLRTVMVVALGHFAVWLVSVLVVTLAGYPGVVCITPVAWLLAARAGLVCVRRSTSVLMARRLQEAALAGGLLGFLQGILFWIIAPRMGPIAASEQAGEAVLVAAMLVMGVLAGAALAAFTAYLYERRRRAA
jgi:hypothetical protein